MPTETIDLFFFYYGRKVLFKARISPDLMFHLSLTARGRKLLNIEGPPLVEIVPVHLDNKTTRLFKGFPRRESTSIIIRGCPYCFYIWESGTKRKTVKCPKCGELIINGQTITKSAYMKRRGR